MIVRKHGVAVFDFEGLGIRDYTAGHDTDCSFAVVQVPTGAAHRAAWSRRSDKYYYVASGSVEFVESGATQVLTAGDFCLVRQGERFSYRNAGDVPAELCLFHSPGFDPEAEVFA